MIVQKDSEMRNKRFPKLFIRSKNDLSKHISDRRFTQKDGLNLINDVISNFNSYWKDSKSSEPEKNKYVRSAIGTKLDILLKRLNSKLLIPHDNLLPAFIFGGISGQSHVMGAHHLLGNKRKRTLIKLDIERFYEQIDSDMVSNFFETKCHCNHKISIILSNICCVPFGPKGSDAKRKVIARGFATSSRLSVWCNLNLFVKLDSLIKKRLKGHDPRLMIYIDDIGITASRVSMEKMKSVRDEIINILFSKGSMSVNSKKTEVVSYLDGMEILGLRLGRNKLQLGAKSYNKRNNIKNSLKKELPSDIRNKTKTKYRGIAQYKKYIEGINKN